MGFARHGIAGHATRIASDLVGTLAAVLIFGACARAQTDAPVAPAPVPPQTEGQAPSDDLSHRLDRSHGVIRPQGDLDPGISAAPPDPNPGTMPVIPPPGSPGGDERVQPK